MSEYFSTRGERGRGCQKSRKSLKGFNRKVTHSGALKGKLKVKAKREKGKRQKKKIK